MGRSASPGPKRGAQAASDGAAEASAPAAAEAEPAAPAAPSSFAPPPRPAGLRGSLLGLYGALAVSMLFFVLMGQMMEETIPEGKFKNKKDGKVIDVGDFDAAELGPYPKCHPHFKEHLSTLENGTQVWVKNSDVGSGGPFPAGHPDNPEWVEKANAQATRENEENRFTWAGLQPNLHLLTLSVFCVTIGSKHGVYLFTEPVGANREQTQVLQKEDAMWFPIMGSCVLFGLFVVLKYLGSDFIKQGITCGIVLMCTFGVGTNLDHTFALLRSKTNKPLLTIPFLDQSVTLMELLGWCIGGVMAAGFIFSKNWIINNVFGVSFCLLGIKMIGISSYKTGAIMLVGLFFYDIFWVFGSKPVFGSNVMVSVAKGVEAPIKLMFPRSVGGCGNLQHSMLGLGDIVVPGIFIAFLAKWDAVLIGEKKARSFVYLNVVMVAYVLSLLTTVSIMLFFNAAQPALLYIVPYVLLASIATALARGEFSALWAYTVEDELGAEGTKPKEGETEKKEK